MDASSTIWHVFGDTYSLLDAPLIDAQDAMVSAAVDYITPAIRPLLVIYVIWLGFCAIYAGASVRSVMSQAIRAGVIVVLVAHTDTYMQWVGNFFLHVLPDGLGVVFNGAVNGVPIKGGEQFDKIWAAAAIAGSKTYESIPSLISAKGVVLALLCLAFLLASFICVGICFVLFLVSHVAMVLLIIAGPLFIVCAMFPGSRGFAAGWLSTCVSVVTTQVLLILLLSVMVRVMQSQLIRFATPPVGDDTWTQCLALIGIGGLLGICAYLAKQVPSLASSISGGVALQLDGVLSGAARAAGALSRFAHRGN